MAQPHIEGTLNELTAYMAEHPGQRFRLIVLPESEEAKFAPNEELLAMLRDVAAMKAGMEATDEVETDRLLREARAGAMYSNAARS